MSFKPTLKQALGLTLIRGYDHKELIKMMSEEEAQEFAKALQIVADKLRKGKFPGRDYSPSSQDSSNMARRKAKNIAGGSTTGVSAMPHEKPYGGSGPSAASESAKKQKKLSAKNPTKIIRDGKVVDMVHSSGRKKGKTIFSSDEERQKHLKGNDG